VDAKDKTFCCIKFSAYRKNIDKSGKCNIIKNSSEYYFKEHKIAEKKKYNQSRQRNRILELLKGTGTHPTAAWLYEQMKGEFSNLSMGTVYRNLSILCEQGLVQKRGFGSTFDRFEAHIEPHYHFICEQCHRIIDLNIPVDEGLNQKIGEATPYVAKRHTINFYGICDECRGRAEE